MGNDEDFILRHERRRLNEQNTERARHGLPLLPIPEMLMNETELEKARHELLTNERKARCSSSERAEIYDKKNRLVYDEEGVSIDYGD